MSDRRKILLYIAILIIVGLAAYGLDMFTPSLFGDEWGMVVRWPLDGELACPDTTHLFMRPLARCWPAALFGLFGLDIVAFHVSTIIVTILASVAFFLLLGQILQPAWFLSLVIAFLFLVYPTVFVHQWILIGLHQLTIILAAACTWLIWRYYKGGSWRFWVAGVLLCGVVISANERFVGIVLLSSVAAFALSKNVNWTRRATLLLPAVLALSYSVGRWRTQLAHDGLYGHQIDSLELSIGGLISRFVMAYRLNLLWTWNESVRRAIPWFDIQGREHLAYGLILAMVVMTALGTTVLWRTRSASNEPRGLESRGHLRETLGRKLSVAIAGLLLLGAGYVPMVLTVNPGTAFTASRANILPSLGAAIFLGASLSMIPSLLGHTGRQAQITLAALAIPFVVLGVVSQISVNGDTQASWEEQRSIWRQLFRQVPDIKRDSYVVLVLHGTEDSGDEARPIESGPWSFGNALSTLYGVDGLTASFHYGSLTDIEVTKTGVIDPQNGQSIPFEQVILVEYARDEDKLRVVGIMDGLGTQRQVGTPGIVTHVSSGDRARQELYRWLVE
jgi:hypothetical protein